jgi:hypothetical protein
MLPKIFCIAALSTVLGLGTAEGSTIAANLFSPIAPPGSSPVLTNLTGFTTPSQATVTGSGFTIGFAGVATDQGLVQGSLAGAHATPVAGVTAGGSAAYMTGGFGAPLTPNIDLSGNYLSTGFGTITITFLRPQTSFALLWGSIDIGNLLSFNDASNFNVTAAAVQTAAAGFVASGFQGPGGSAYVVINTDTPFTTVTASSSVISFEFVPIAASTTPFDTANPEPAGFVLMAGGILLLLAYRRRTMKRLS